MRPPRMIPALSRVRNLPNAEFVNPPLPGLHVEQVCRKPLQVSLKKSDVTSNEFSISSVSFQQSTLNDFLRDFSGNNEIDGIRVKVVSEAGVAGVLRFSTDSDFHNLTCDDQSWHQLCMANKFKEGDKIAVWLFTRNNAVEELWMAIVLTQKRRYRSIAMM